MVCAPGLESLVCDFSLPAELGADIPRIAADVVTTAYFIVAETLTNVVKHARATAASVKLTINDANLGIEVRDDGVGGADPSQGPGLTGLLDRVEASSGILVITSPAGKGTTARATVPIRLCPGRRHCSCRRGQLPGSGPEHQRR